jgi:hypothetical protein
MKFTKNFASTNIFGHKPNGAITFLNAKGQMVGKHPPTVNPPAPNSEDVGPLVPTLPVVDWTFASNYKCYPIDTKPVDGGVVVRVGGSVDACRGLVFKDNPSAINYGKQICDYWETGTLPPAPDGVVSDDETIRNSRTALLNAGTSAGVLKSWIVRRIGSGEKVNSFQARNAAHAKEKYEAFHGKPLPKDLEVVPHSEVVAEKNDYKDWKTGYGLHNSEQVLNAGTKEGFKKALDTRSATGAKNAASSAVHFKNEAKRHSSGLFVKGKKPDLEKASKAANLATGAAVVADASAREADTAPAYDQAIIAHQAAADAHKAARGGVKGDHQSPSRTKESAHLRSIEDLKGLKQTISNSAILNAGTSAGVYEAWQTRRGNVSQIIKARDDASKMEASPQRFPAYNRSVDAWKATQKAEQTGTAEDHGAAAQAHHEAARQFDGRNKSHDEASLAHEAKLKELKQAITNSRILNGGPGSGRKPGGSRWFDNRHGSGPNPNLFEVKDGEQKGGRVEYGGPKDYHHDPNHSGQGRPVPLKFLEDGAANEGHLRELNLGHGPTPEGLLRHIKESDDAMYSSKTPEQFAAHKASRDAFEATDKHGVSEASHAAHDYAASLHEARGNHDQASVHRDFAKLHIPYNVDKYGRRI